MATPQPGIGDWYRLNGGSLFEVVALDDDDGTIEIQYFDGTVEELDIEDWEAQWEDRDVRAPAAFGSLTARGARAGFARKDHLERQQEEQEAAEDAEGFEADPHQPEEGGAAKRKEQQDRGGDDHRSQRHAALVGARGTGCQPGEERNQRHRFDHDEKDDEKLQRLLEHWCYAQKKRNELRFSQSQ